jgi:nitrogen fixation NifU-like protein
MDDLYRDYILEHYRHPHNFGVLDSPTASYEGANPLCGDRITMMLGISDGVVREVAFTGRGCAISQASASLLTDEIKGKTVEEVEKMTPDDLLDLIGIEISPARLKCALLSLDTVARALADEASADEASADEASATADEASAAADEASAAADEASAAADEASAAAEHAGTPDQVGQ